MSLGAAIGAITFSGSIIAFLKLRGIMSGSPITFKAQHFINLLLGLSIFALIYYLCVSQSPNIFWSLVLISFLLGVLLIIPIGGADMLDARRKLVAVQEGATGDILHCQ